MATFYHGGSEIQAEGLQTLYLMNPGYVGYPDGQGGSAAATNMVFLNSAGNPLNPGNLGHAHQQNQHFVGIPLQPTSTAGSVPTWQDTHRHSAQHDISPVHGFISRLHWGSMDASAGAASGSHHAIQSTPDVASQLGVRRAPSVQQGLSLSLSPQKSAYAGYRSESEIQALPSAISPGSGEDIRISGSTSSNSGVSNGITGIQSVLMGSKYLKAAQQLLDEVVNVGKGIKDDKMKANKGHVKANKEPAPENSGGETSARRSVELTTAERQELQMKKAKLLGMLDEVEQRYRQYHHQMQLVVSSFEAAAGFGSAKTYTALALQTISKQFRCLRDAITGQIRATSKSLGEEDCLGGKMEGSRLKFVDQHLRQQRALQQLGMIQHNAWRPQRGLPERSVSVLRAWLFEHFLHPYPKDSDKLMLAKQTGLTRSQVSNWFINARVRLWKPMVEEMYVEETKEQVQNGSEDKAVSKSEDNEESASKSTSAQENSPTASRATEHMNSLKFKPDSNSHDRLPSTSLNPSPTAMGGVRNQSCFPLMATSEPEARNIFQDKEGMMQRHPKKTRNEFQTSNATIPLMSEEVDLKPEESDSQELCEERQNRNGYSLITSAASHGGGFGAFQLGDMGSFDPEQFAPRFPGNGVSLTLGLPHCENLSLSGTQQSFLSNQSMQMGRRLEMGNEANDFCSINTPTTTHSSNAYESLSIQSRKRFAAQLLPDFVA
ncbi:BEL1-like homeodomain protein 1 [Aristolochia californica]|uniref:BEL1-like homeodomain protein 1 n=1 Tax=Aristolochia californica TaxID=171875 RepID=UPI0035DEC323